MSEVLKDSEDVSAGNVFFKNEVPNKFSCAI
jgi:hypothetical protein